MRDFHQMYLFIVYYGSVSQPGVLDPLGGPRELPGDEMAGEIIVLNYLVKLNKIKVSDLTMKTTTDCSHQLLLVYLLYIHTHHVN